MIKCDYRIFVQTSWNHQRFFLFDGNVWHIEWEKDSTFAPSFSESMSLERDFTLVNSDEKLSRSKIISSRINRSDNFPPIFLARKLWIVWGRPYFSPNLAVLSRSVSEKLEFCGVSGMFYPDETFDRTLGVGSFNRRWARLDFLGILIGDSVGVPPPSKDTKGLWIAHRCAAATDKLRSVRTIRELINKKGWKLPLDLFLFRRRVGFFYGLSFWMYIPHHLAFFLWRFPNIKGLPV